MKKVVKSIIRLLIEIVAVTALIIGVRILTDGMYLCGLPDLKEVQSVSILYPSVAEEAKEISSDEDLETALKLTGFLKYDIFQKADDSAEPLITITYYLKDGTNKAISANDTTVWWNGKAYAIKDQEMFINLTEGIFFLGD